VLGTDSGCHGEQMIPAVGAEVSRRPAPSRETLTTDASGFYESKPRRRGTCSVCVEATRLEPNCHGEPFVVTDTSPFEVRDFVLAPGEHTISGRILLADGSPTLIGIATYLEAKPDSSVYRARGPIAFELRLRRPPSRKQL
jgi:hypothetical protein